MEDIRTIYKFVYVDGDNFFSIPNDQKIIYHLNEQCRSPIENGLLFAHLYIDEEEVLEYQLNAMVNEFLDYIPFPIRLYKGLGQYSCVTKYMVDLTSIASYYDAPSIYEERLDIIDAAVAWFWKNISMSETVTDELRQECMDNFSGLEIISAENMSNNYCFEWVKLTEEIDYTQLAPENTEGLDLEQNDVLQKILKLQTIL